VKIPKPLDKRAGVRQDLLNGTTGVDNNKGNRIVKNIKRGAVITAIAVGAPLATATAASATNHTDPCLGQHIQVWAEVGNNGAGQATDHFVCGPLKGEKGDKGETGPQGPKGEKGDTGPTGAASTVPGPQGPAGAPGANGLDSNVPGPAGPAGPSGASIVGPVGPQGSPGETGPQGPKGETGESGANGHDGAPGLNGTDGANGKDGKDGVTKTVVVNQDGTTTTVAPLPHTGTSSDQNWAIGGVAAALILGGAGVTYAIRRRNI
jgi:LPXTG-motif cell wall-anchored protein